MRREKGRLNGGDSSLFISFVIYFCVYVTLTFPSNSPSPREESLITSRFVTWVRFLCTYSNRNIVVTVDWPRCLDSSDWDQSMQLNDYFTSHFSPTIKAQPGS